MQWCPLRKTDSPGVRPDSSSGGCATLVAAVVPCRVFAAGARQRQGRDREPSLLLADAQSVTGRTAGPVFPAPGGTRPAGVRSPGQLPASPARTALRFRRCTCPHSSKTLNPCQQHSWWDRAGMPTTSPAGWLPADPGAAAGSQHTPQPAPPQPAPRSAAAAAATADDHGTGIRFQPQLAHAVSVLGTRPGYAHLCVAGPPGCGQGIAAELLARGGPVSKVVPGELFTAHAAEAISRLRRRWDDARGGVLYLVKLEELFADANAAPLLDAFGDLITRDPAGDVTVLLAGDPESVSQLQYLSPALHQQFWHAQVHGFTPDQLVALLTGRLRAEGLTTDPSFSRDAARVLRGVRPVGDLCNGRIVDAAVRGTVDRLAAEGRKVVSAADLPADRLPSVEVGVGDAFTELDRLIGLSEVKSTVRLWAANVGLSSRREQLGLDVSGMGHHMVFKGPAGTAKTTVARIVARVLAETGVLASGHLVEVQRGDLVGEHSEQTARRVIEAVKRSLGGVLFIDEAYTLTEHGDTGRDSGREVVETILKLMEDYREDFVVIVAGYTLEMEKFLNSNPGLQSRFAHELTFPSYDVDELLAILRVLAAQRGYQLADAVEEALRPALSLAMHYPMFGNGRHIRNLLEAAIVQQGTRLTVDAADADIVTLTAADFTASAAGKTIRAPAS